MSWKEHIKQRKAWDTDLKANAHEIREQAASDILITGTLYANDKVRYTKGVLLVHGFAGNNHALGVLAQALVELGYCCLSIDLPQHYGNPTPLTMGHVGEMTRLGVRLLRAKTGVKEVAVIGHSMGAVGALFALAGYDRKLEQQLPVLWKQFLALTEQHAWTVSQVAVGKRTFEEAKATLQALNAGYTALKQLVFEALKSRLQSDERTSCQILLAPPRQINDAFLGVGLVRNWSNENIKRVLTPLLHNPTIKQNIKEGGDVAYVTRETDAFKFQYFSSSEIGKFLNYILECREPLDYLTTINAIIAATSVPGKARFFEYYKKKYITFTPKLFIYGKNDILLRPFLPWRRKKLEHFYGMFAAEGKFAQYGTVEIFRGNFSHMMLDNPFQVNAVYVAKNAKVIDKISDFLAKHLRDTDAEFLSAYAPNLASGNLIREYRPDEYPFFASP